jgi:peptidoglycan/LPS O-acetylase OafA/YrhL
VLSRVRHWPAWVRRLDPLAVDRAVAAALFAVMEALIWLSPHARFPGTQSVAAGTLCVAAAVRRRWLLPALCLGIVAVLGCYAVDGSGDKLGNGPAGVFASVLVLLLFYAGGAFWDGRQAWTAPAGSALGCRARFTT